MTPLPWLALAEEWSGSAPHPPQLNARASDRGDIKKKEGRKEEGEFGGGGGGGGGGRGRRTLVGSLVLVQLGRIDAAMNLRTTCYYSLQYTVFLRFCGLPCN